MGIADAFLHDILTHPDDDAPRLIYADWLDEHNDPRGEFIRVQCALAQLRDEDPRRWPLEQREQELLQEHEAKWLPKDIGNVPCVFRRGFVEEISLFTQDFPIVAERLFEQTPLQHLCLRLPIHAAEIARSREGRGWECVCQSPYLARLRELTLSFHPCLEDWRSFGESPYLANLTHLKLLPDRSLATDSIDWAVLLHRPRLHSLTLSHQILTLEDLPVLANASSLSSLRELNLNGNLLTHEAVRVLAEGRLLSQLETLHLDSNLLGDAGALTIRDWPSLPRLSRLSLGHNYIFATGVQALAEAPALSELISLDLFGNISCDAGVAALTASSRLAHLRALNLRFNGVGDEGVRRLAQSENCAQLTCLNLTANRITSAGARDLIASPHLPSLARLDLLRNDIDATEQQRLRDRFGAFVSY
ncbi:MAG TPA: TIGR02996 domain-containing protein [Gemmataceae bacterium]|nr:TIGR02996 domain-containing protein [Gemmataceae bacterium]